MITTYQYQGQTWVQYGSTIERGRTLSLSYDGQFITVGSAGNSAVYVFDSETDQWMLRHEIASGDGLGITPVGLSQDGNVLVEGDPSFAALVGTGQPKRMSGRCSIYQWNGETTQYELLYALSGERKNEELGGSVAVSDDGNIVACGGATGRWDENNAFVSGVVRLWNRQTSRQKSLWPSGDYRPIVDKGSFGSALTLSTDGDLLFVGASSWKGSNGGSPGAVHIFDTSTFSEASSISSTTTSSGGGGGAGNGSTILHPSDSSQNNNNDEVTTTTTTTDTTTMDEDTPGSSSSNEGEMAAGDDKEGTTPPPPNTDDNSR